jgi:hypothetical protein
VRHAISRPATPAGGSRAPIPWRCR